MAKILVAIATRGRPLLLAGALHSFKTLQSGENEIRYVVGLDYDDEVSLALESELHAQFDPIHTLVSERRPTLGEAWNTLALYTSHWDMACVIADKHVCLTPGWDNGIAELAAKDVPLARWTLHPNELETAPIVSRTWYDTFGQLLPEWFPFWFSERWLVEVHTLAFGTGIPRVTDLKLAEPVLKTQNLRDLEFWFEFFAKTRVLRIIEARKIAAVYERVLPDIQPIIAEMRRADDWQKPRIPIYYEHRGAPLKEPSPQYIEAKRRAEQWLAEHYLKYTETAGAA